MKMKQSFHFKLCLLLFIFIIFSSSLAANPTVVNQDRGQDLAQQTKFSVITSSVSDIPMEDDGESLSVLMGMEKCEEADEECLKRRMISEAHLDYIYTQHHKH